jgi:hypothetical protein
LQGFRTDYRLFHPHAHLERWFPYILLNRKAMKYIYHSPKIFNEAMEYLLISMAVAFTYATALMAWLALYLLTI